jgi:hypothetical protein
MEFVSTPCSHIPSSSIFYLCSLNPIWSVDNGSLFIVSQSAEEFFSAGYGLTFIVKDYDKVTSNEEICEVSISAADLLKQTGERTSYELEILEAGRASTKVFRPKLNLRIRKATLDDKVFMKYLQALRSTKKKSKICGVYANASFLAPKPERVNPFKKEKKIVDGVKKVCFEDAHKKIFVCRYGRLELFDI